MLKFIEKIIRILRIIMKEQNDILTVEHLKKSYGKLKAVNDISFSVKKGEIFGILGPNGAGKTTTLEMLETLTPIDQGNAFINNVDIKKNPKKIKQLIGIQLQSTSFYDNLNLKELLEMFGTLYGVKPDVNNLLQKVELLDKAKSYINQLSGGQKQRFAITSALVNNPVLLFLDEPTTGLDPQARRNLWDLIKSIQKEGISIVLTTHYMDEAEILCDRLAIMDNGKIITINTPKNLIKELLDRGFKKPKEVQQANLEDVFIDLTGKAIRE